jgi:hypothetical protein
MPLNLTMNDGDFTPYIKYNAKAGRWYVKGENGEIEVSNPRLVFDFENIKTGWIYYPKGAAPVRIWNASATGAFIPKPDDGRDFRQGFEVMVLGPDKLPDGSKVGLREFSSAATNCFNAIKAMFVIYEQAVKTNAGKLPFFQFTGAEAITGIHGVNFEPTFRLIGWVEREKLPELNLAKGNGRSVNPPTGDDWQAPLEHPGNERPEDALDDEIPF